jgi:hypothetical protein
VKLIDFFTDQPGYIQIKFQSGPIPEVGVNGTTIEDVLLGLAGRLRQLQSSDLPCPENNLAITFIEQAVTELKRRTERRIAQGVEGTMEPHVYEE